MAKESGITEYGAPHPFFFDDHFHGIEDENHEGLTAPPLPGESGSAYTGYEHVPRVSPELMARLILVTLAAP